MLPPYFIQVEQPAPKVAQHKYSGLAYNGWQGAELLFSADDIIFVRYLCFMFLLAVIIMGAISSGAHVVSQHLRVTEEMEFLTILEVNRTLENYFYYNSTDSCVTIDAKACRCRYLEHEASFLRIGSPMPMELFRRFEGAAGVEIIEGYGFN